MSREGKTLAPDKAFPRIGAGSGVPTGWGAPTPGSWQKQSARSYLHLSLASLQNQENRKKQSVSQRNNQTLRLPSLRCGDLPQKSYSAVPPDPLAFGGGMESYLEDTPSPPTETQFRNHIPVDSPDPDDVVMATAQRPGAVLISLDGDFSDIVSYPPADYIGIIALQVRNHPEVIPALMSRLLDYFALHGEMTFYWRKLLLVEAHRIRIRTCYEAIAGGLLLDRPTDKSAGGASTAGPAGDARRDGGGARVPGLSRRGLHLRADHPC